MLSVRGRIQQFRNKIISYERLVNVVYDDLMLVYKPLRLRIVMTLSPRGGISSRLVIDSRLEGEGRKGNVQRLGRPAGRMVIFFYASASMFIGALFCLCGDAGKINSCLFFVFLIFYENSNGIS